MKYSVDRIVNNIAILENINTGKIMEININKLPNNIRETDILIFENGIYILDINEKQKRINMLREKMNSLKKY